MYGQKTFAFFLLIALSVEIFDGCSARAGKYLVQKKGYAGIGSQHSGNTPSQRKLVSSTTFSVLSYGAKGDGKTDDTKAFEATWEAACKETSATMLIPSGHSFLVKPISFSGTNCQPNIVFQLDGNIIAPTGSGAWGKGLLQWIEFTKIQGITIQGKGIVDGQGSVWWRSNSPTFNPMDETELNVPLINDLTTNNTIDYELKANMPNTKPTAIRFYGSTNVVVSGITIQNSPQTHLKFDDCSVVQVFDFTTSSPGDSPNTDGIHLQNSQDVVIYRSKLACGDDCVSIQTGCSNIYVHNVVCGPGHGISIGSLGKQNTKACVSNITVRDITMHNTLTGVRIKTWQGGSGSVQGVLFSNIQVSEVETPVIIDQYYCDKSTCGNQTSAVAVSDIQFMNIKGTYTRQAVHLACSDSLPCTGVNLASIQLEPVKENHPLFEPFCWEAYGELKTKIMPPVNCLQEGSPSSIGTQSDIDSC